MKFVVGCFFLLVALQKITCCPRGYYWRDFNGTVPEDAVPGGLNREGKPTYIGQVLHGDKLIPAQIFTGDRYAHFPLSKYAYTTTKHIKVLCGDNFQQFKWVRVRHDEINLLTEHQPIPGGYEPRYILYIGRIFHQLETVTGKIANKEDGTEPLGLYIAFDGMEFNFKTFEILTYDQNCNTCVDLAGKVKENVSSGTN